MTSYTDSITKNLPKLSKNQLAYVDAVVTGLARKMTVKSKKDSDIATGCFVELFSIELLGHHAGVNKAMNKLQFEYAMEKVLKLCNCNAELAPPNNPGADISIDDVPCSLKTQSNKSISEAFVWISKFMELGRGDWSDKEKDLVGLRAQFFDHMKKYDRIFVLRAFAPKNSGRNRRQTWKYELLEIPKALLEEAKDGVLEMKQDAEQMPKPGYCTVTDEEGNVKFKLYFDGGTERKLQIKNLCTPLCVTHATWEF